MNEHEDDRAANILHGFDEWSAVITVKNVRDSMVILYVRVNAGMPFFLSRIG